MMVDKRLGGVPQWYIEPREDCNMRVPDEIKQCVVFIAKAENIDQNMVIIP